VRASLICTLCFLLASCITMEPQSIGRDTYLIETLGTNMTYQPALKKANAFCAKEGKRVQLVSATEGGVAVSAHTSLTFMCLSPNDPRYKAPSGP
jgi:starvation-inducible outer membrane lipoprotein